MDRARRTRILVHASRDLARTLARRVRSSCDVLELEAANHGLVMAKMRETAKASLFYLGDILITEAKVRIGDALGIGLVAGDAPEMAMDMAVVDAAYNARLPVTEEWESELEAHELLIEAEERAEDSRIGRTRVSFESMDRA